MPFNIRDFHAEFNRNHGFAKASNFEVNITAPPTELVTFPGLSDFRFRIDAIDIPGRSVGQVPYLTYGPPQTVGTLANYVPINLSIILSPNLIERDFFLAWQDLIVGKHRTQRNVTNNRFDIGYYENYAKRTRLVITQFADYDALPFYKCSLTECWPSLVSPITGTWASSEPQRCSVTMMFRYFFDEQLNAIPDLPDRQTTLLTRLAQSSVGGAIGTGLGILSGRTGPGPFAIAAGISSAARILNNNGTGRPRALMYNAARIAQ